MAACQQSMGPSKRATPPALDESSISETKDEGFLDWTFTPHFMMLKDGHSRCFIATARTTKETRQKALHLVREVDIEPSYVKKDTTQQKPHPTSKPKEIRVREEDLRKCGPNLELLRQCALPRMEPNTIQKKKKGADTDDKTSIKRASSLAGLECNSVCETPLHLPTLLTPLADKLHRKKTYRRSKSHSTHHHKGDLHTMIWRSGIQYKRESLVASGSILPRASTFGQRASLPDKSHWAKVQASVLGKSYSSPALIL